MIGESFSEIFFGNALIIGLPCLTASLETVTALMERVNAHPDAVLRVDLGAGTCEIGDFGCTVTLPPHARDALVTGAWDTTSLLLERYEEVDATAAKLPYVGDWSA